MPRRRFAVALLAPPDLAGELDALRLAVGARRPPNIAPHITLIPPVNVADDPSGTLAGVVRSAASLARPFDLTVGPAATFAPRTPTVHLEVDAPEALDELRERLRVGPFDRPDDHRPFVAHLTLDASSQPPIIEAAMIALGAYRRSWTVTVVHLLEHRADDRLGAPRWHVVAEEPLGPPVVVGRGGVEVCLRVLHMVDDAVATLTRTSPLEPSGARPAIVPLAVVAESGVAESVVAESVVAETAVCEDAGPADAGRDAGLPLAGAAVGCVEASISRLEAVVVHESARGLGIGPHLVHQWCSAAADAGASAVLVDLRAGNRWPGEFAFLDRLGFTGTAGYMIRRL